MPILSNQSLMAISPLPLGKHCDYNRKRQNEAEQNDLREACDIDDGQALRQIIAFDDHGRGALPDEAAKWELDDQRLRLWRQAGITNHDRLGGIILDTDEFRW